MKFNPKSSLDNIHLYLSPRKIYFPNILPVGQKPPQANISYLIAGAGVNGEKWFTWGLFCW